MSAKRRGVLRHPRTTQECRANGRRNVLDFDEYRVFIRPARSTKRLPNAWDDLWIHDAVWMEKWWPHHICWKKLRKNQYFIVDHQVNLENSTMILKKIK